VISERKLAETFTSFWRDNLRTGEEVVKFVNGQLNGVFDSLESEVSPRRRELVNEGAFLLATLRAEQQLLGKGKPSREILDRACAAAMAQAARMHRIDPDTISPLDTRERDEVLKLGERLEEIFGLLAPGGEMLPRPPFAGCGIVKSCHGDVLADGALYEVKAGEKNFRLVDLRQLFIYGALNYAERRYELGELGYVNPRRGVWYREEVEVLVRLAAGVSAVELFSEIVDFISSDRVSG